MHRGFEMKKIITMVLCLILVLSLGACGTKAAGNGVPVAGGSNMPEKNDASEGNTNTSIVVDPTMPVPNVYESHKPYTYNVAFANWSDDNSIYVGALNSKTMAISSVQHLPIYKFDTKADLDAFKESFSGILTMDQGLDETPSFDYITTAYDDSFFSKYSLMLAYVQASSGSFRFGVSDVSIDGQSFCMYIEQVNNPEAYDCMMAGWFAIAEINKDDIAECTDFDAQLRPASLGSGLAETENSNIRADVCALYLQVLEDLWNVDSGLNGGITQIGIDLSKKKQ